jgi:hypothetical protein
VKKDEIAVTILRFMRTVILADLILAAIVGLACYVLDLRSFAAYGTVLVWAGTAVIVLAGFIGIGGFASRTEDAVAYSRSGAGNMIDNLQHITNARSSNLGCIVHLVTAALLLIGAGYLVQIIPL